jgi:hypothetical protein
VFGFVLQPLGRRAGATFSRPSNGWPEIIVEDVEALHNNRVVHIVGEEEPE